MPNELVKSVKSALSDYHLETNGILLAVSGGKDSMVLMALLKEIQPELSNAVMIAHYDHGWRDESEQDAIFVMEETARMGFSCILGRPETLPEDDEKTEAIAREQRYQFLTRTARKNHCGIVLTAHTADDQIETVLHNLFRGTGLGGLTGMSRCRILDGQLQLIRPLLTVTRTEIDQYAVEKSIPYREDTSNESLKYTRNRIRHEVLSWLESNGFESTRESVLRLSRQADEVQETLVWAAKDRLRRALKSSTPDRIELSAEVLRPLPRHLVREIFVELWRQQEWSRQEMGFADWDRLADLVHTPARFHVSGQIDCCQKRGKIILERKSG